MPALSQGTQKLRSLAARGAIVLVIARLITRGLDLVTLVALGRLLSPTDFGLVAIAMSIVQILEAILELPLSLALMTLSTRTKSHFDSAFTLQLLRGLVLTGIVLAIAWPLSLVYDDHRLIWLLFALAAAPASRGLISPRTVEYAIKFNYLPSLTMDVAGKCTALAASVSVAWFTGSYWSIAVATIASPVTMLILSYCFAPYRPAFSLKEWRTFESYLRASTAAQLVAAVVWQMDQLLLGRFVSRADLGQFSMASNLAVLPLQVLVNQITSPLTVAFSAVKQDPDRLRAAYHKSAVGIMTIGLPILVWVSVNSDAIVRLVIGQKWLEAAPILHWLALGIIPSLFVGPLMPLATTLNRTVAFFRLNLAELCLKTPLMLVAIAHYGIAGVIAVRLVTATAVAGYAMYMVRGFIGLSLRGQLLGPWRAAASVAIATAAMIGAQHAISDANDMLSVAVKLAAVSVSGAICYWGTMFVLWSAAGRPDGLEDHIVKVVGGYWRRIHA
ncbi:oligosaccharide flippase family protein [Bradyrhizobium sp.]|uniref:oligosaccharide flippase family protein n=1 Tax=Bradyrhizobium sp. TaxID=376 RepID=UPI00291283B6|nr:oligosaccharide flippase family protein [Bradyrhizobium sp.]MDU6134717.1 oligosaccharide flippase family protein [Bradyrhizobium sp.]